jgi:outer membrane protein assembly factor BamB
VPSQGNFFICGLGISLGLRYQVSKNGDYICHLSMGILTMKRANWLILIVFMTLFFFVGCKSEDGGSNSNSDNNAPVVDAGIDQNVTTGSTVTLDGSNSSDIDEDSITFTWTLISQPSSGTATLSESTSERPTFVPDADGTYIIRLIVSDGIVSSNSDTVTITASSVSVNNAPLADAGIDQNVTTGSTVTLDGSSSSDIDGDSLTYSWIISSQPGGGNASLSSATDISPTFVPDVDGSYIINLTVNDGMVDSTVDTVTVVASTESLNNAPIANAGADQTTNIYVFGTVTLDGSGSSDPDDDSFSYSWSIITRPAGSTSTLVNQTTSAPILVPDKPGLFVLSLVVNDGSINSSADTVTVNVSRIIWKNAGIGMNVFGNPFALDENGIIHSGHSNGIRAIDSADGNTVWSANFLDTIIHDVAYYDGSVYAIAYSSSANTYLYAYDTSGDQQWNTLLGKSMEGPVVDHNHNVYVSGYYNFWTVDASGTITNSGSPGTAYSYGPIFDAVGNTYLGGSNSSLYSFDVTGDARWQYTAATDYVYGPAIDDNDTTADVSDDIIYVGSRDNKLHAVHASDGSQIWTFDTSDDIYAQPIIGPDGTIYIGSSDDKFYAVNPNGILKWSFDTSGDISSAAALASDGTIYFGSKNASRSGWSVIYSLNSGGNLRWNLELYGGAVWSGIIITADCKIITAPQSMYLYGLYDDCSGPETSRWPTHNKNNARNGQ